MSVSNPRQKSAFAPIKPDISVPLDVQREHSRLRLKSAWDSIIERYSQEFDDDDEIDLLTEEIVVDRGFLRNQPIRKIGTLTKYMEEYEDEESSGTDSESDTESESDEESADEENQENIDQLPDEIVPASKHSGRKKSKKSSKSNADKETDDQENDDVYDDIFLNLVNSTKGKFSKLKYTPKSRVSMDCNRSVKSATNVLETAKHTIDELIYDCDEDLKVEVEKTLLNAATEQSNILENEKNTTLDNIEVTVIKEGFSSRKTTVKRTVTSAVDRSKRNNLKSKSSKMHSNDSSQSDSDYAEGRKGRTFKSKLPNSPPSTIHDDSETESDPSLQQIYQPKPRPRGRPPKSRPISDATRLKSAKSAQEFIRRRGRPPKSRPISDTTGLKSSISAQESTDDTESEVESGSKSPRSVTVKRKRRNITDDTSKGSKIKAFENSENTEPKLKKSKISVAKLTSEDISLVGRQQHSSKRLELKTSTQSETTDSDSDFASFSASVSKTKLQVKNHRTRSPMQKVEKLKSMNAKEIRKTLEELGVSTSTTFSENKKCRSPRSLLSPHQTRHSKSTSSPHKKHLSIVSEQTCSVSSAQISQDDDFDEYQPPLAEFNHDDNGSRKELSTSTLVSSSDATSIVTDRSCAEISCNDDVASAEESVFSQQVECDYDGGLISGPGEEDEEDECRSGPEDEGELSESERFTQENRKLNKYVFPTLQYPQICKKRRQHTSHFPSTQQHSNHRHPNHHPPQYNHPFQSSGHPHLSNYFSHFNPFPYPSPYYQYNPTFQQQYPHRPYPTENPHPGQSTHKQQSQSDHTQDEDRSNDHFSNPHQHHANHIHPQTQSSNQQTHQPQHPQPSTYTVPITVQVPLQMPYPHFPTAAAVPPIQVNQIHQHHYTLNTINNHNDKALIYNGSGNPEQLLNLGGSRSLTGVDSRAGGD